MPTFRIKLSLKISRWNTKKQGERKTCLNLDKNIPGHVSCFLNIWPRILARGTEVNGILKA